MYLSSSRLAKYLSLQEASQEQREVGVCTTQSKPKEIQG